MTTHEGALWRRVVLAFLLAVPVASRGAVDEKRPTDAPPANRAPARDPSAKSAAQVAQEYAETLRSGDAVKAVKTYWDFDAMMRRAFGEHLKRNSDAERAEMRRLLLGFIQTIYSNPELRRVMARARFGKFEEKEEADGTTTVNYTAAFDGQAPIPNAVRMQKVDGRWRVIDAGARGDMMVGTIRKEYLAQANRITPLQYMRALAKQQ